LERRRMKKKKNKLKRRRKGKKETKIETFGEYSRPKKRRRQYNKQVF